MRHQPQDPSQKSEYLDVGDVVRVNHPGPHVGIQNEGVIVERITDVIVRVDFGDSAEEYDISDCQLLLKAHEFEEGDLVKMMPKGKAYYLAGRIKQVNKDGTLDILMDGDDLDDIEHAVDPKTVMKVMTRRALVIGRWKAAVAAVVTVNSLMRSHHKLK